MKSAPGEGSVVGKQVSPFWPQPARKGTESGRSTDYLIVEHASL
jgi:hypothetical protein